MSAITLHALGLDAETHSTLPSELIGRLAVTLDRPAPSGPLPITWHWIFFVPVVATGGLGHDGHPRRPAGRLTDTYPRRMFAGGRLTSTGGLRPDVEAVRHSELVSADEKEGRSGGLMVVTVRHRYDQAGACVLTEEQDLVYLPIGDTDTPLPERTGEVASDRAWQHVMTPDEALLFRYSALTFNAHRIHYDRPYAGAEERYPGLVVHGPLTATLLADMAADRLGRSLRSFRFRARAPLFAGQPIRLGGDPGGDGAAMEATRIDGAAAMTAEAT